MTTSATSVLQPPVDTVNSLNSARPIRRRLRPVVVCTHCRKRKIKCDKQQPCSNCVKLKVDHLCKYDQLPRKKPHDDFTLEIKLEESFAMKDSALQYGGKDNGLRPSQNVLSNPNIALSTTQKSIRQSEVPPSDHAYRDASSKKSEIEILKERLQQIERSLLRSSPREDNGAFQPPAQPQPQPRPQPQALAQVGLAPVGQMQNPSVEQHHLNGRPSLYSPGPNFPSSNFLMGFSSPAPGPGAFSQQPNLYYSGANPYAAPKRDTLSLSLPPIQPVKKFSHDSSSTFSPNSTSNQSSVGPSHLSASSIPSRSPGSALNQMRPPVWKGADISTDNSLPLQPDMLTGVNIYGSVDDTMNFFEGFSSVHLKDPLRRINFGPFAWSSLMRRDLGLRLVWDHIKRIETNNANSAALIFAQQTSELNQENTNAILEPSKDYSEKQFKKRSLQADGYEELIPYNKIIDARAKRSKQKEAFNKSGLSLGLTVYDGQIERELQLIEKVKVVLPKRKVLWKLIHHFFVGVYSYMPFLDEEYFRRDVEKIVGRPGNNESDINELHIENKLDLATVGILLVVLRLSYLSLFSNNTALNESYLNCQDPTPYVQGMNYLLRNPININTIDVAQLCLDQFQLLRRSNFTVFQLALYLRVYHTYAPEDGDGADGGDSQVFNAVLVQMAIALGLNREPDEQCTDLKINSLSRKIWMYIVVADLHLSFSFGNPPCVDEKFFDTKAPFNVLGGENLFDIEADKEITIRMSMCEDAFKRIREILSLALDVRGKVRIASLCDLLSKFELEWHRNNGSVKDNLKSTQTILSRNFALKFALSTKAFLLTVYFHIYLHYEKLDQKSSYFYLKKCLLMTTLELMPCYSDLLCNSLAVNDMFINPTLQTIMHKADMLYLSVIVRVNYKIYLLNHGPDHLRLCKEGSGYLRYYKLLCQLSSCLTRAAEFTISAISKISNRYYYAWRITKSQIFLLKTITNPSFYEDNALQASPLLTLDFTESQIEEMIQICEMTLQKFRHSEFVTFGFSKEADNQLNSCQFSDADRSEVSSTSSNPSEKVINTEVDKLWLQVLAMKHEKLLGGNFAGELDNNSPNVLSNVPDGVAANPASTQTYDVNSPANFNRLGYELEVANKFDLFSDLPFEQMFRF